MKLVALSVGGPRQIEWRGDFVRTSIFKERVAGTRHVAPLNIDGDQQSDLSVHGGRDKAVYAYPSEHYPLWRRELSEPDLAWGGFGENLTTEGVTEHDVSIGDRLRIGTAEFVVTQPRLPCFKLAIRRDRLDIVKRFQRSGRSGFYLSVVREGELQEGDTIEIVARDERGLSVAATVQLFNADDADLEGLRIAATHPALSPSWRADFNERLAKRAEG
ncbi:MAG: MOSC domain-containing protein [Acidobacteriota bacterium]